MRRRRLRLIVLLALVAGLLVFFQGPTTPKPDPDPDVSAQPDIPAPPASAAPEPEPDPEPDPDRDRDPGPARPEPHPQPHPESPSARADRLAGPMHRFETALAEGRLGQAWQSLQAAAELPSDDVSDRVRAQAQVRLTQAQESLRRALIDEIRAGELLAARARVQRIHTPHDPRAEAWLAELARSRAWPPLAPTAPTASTAPTAAPANGVAPPMPEPGRAVRALLGQQILAGTVQRATDHELAVRIVSDGRVTFPLLARAAVELAEPTPAEAIAEAQAARAAGDALGHALWIAHLVERGLGDDPRVRALFDHR